VWFGADRRLRSEGRAAARQSKNSIVLLAVTPERRYAYDEAVVVRATPGPGSIPLHRTNLARGGRQVIVVPDESAVDLQTEEWARLSRTVRCAHLGLTGQTTALRYRALATIAMAEVARQVGRASTGTRSGTVRGPRYDRALDLIHAPCVGEEVAFADLLAY
jgi:hypothetical protein